MTSISYGEETSTVMNWCEACERYIKPKERFYMCDEYCCVTLHIECLIGKDLYMKSGSSHAIQRLVYFPTIVTCLDLFAPTVRSVVLTKMLFRFVNQ